MLGDVSYLSEKYAGEGCGRETRKKGKKSRDVSGLESTCFYLGQGTNKIPCVKCLGLRNNRSCWEWEPETGNKGSFHSVATNHH